jgi:hypothetical protein
MCDPHATTRIIRRPTQEPIPQDVIRHDLKDSLASLRAAVTLLLSGAAPQGLASTLTEASVLCATHKDSPDVLTQGMVHQLHTITVFLGTCLEDAWALSKDEP